MMIFQLPIFGCPLRTVVRVMGAAALDLPSDFALQLKRAHRSLQQKPTEKEAPLRSPIVRFVNHQHRQQVLAKAWNTANLRYNGKKIYMGNDYSPTVQKRRRE